MSRAVSNGLEKKAVCMALRMLRGLCLLMEAEAARRSAERALATARAREAAIAAPQEPRERLDAVRADLAAVHHRQAQHEAAAVAARHELVVCGAQRAQIAEFLSELDLWPRYTMLDER